MPGLSAEWYAATKRRRLRARRAMFGVAAACTLAALGIGGFELGSKGWNAFLDRPPGVGATPPQDTSAAGAAGSTGGHAQATPPH